MSPNLPIMSVLGNFFQGPPVSSDAPTANVRPLDSGNGRGIARLSTSRGRSYELAGAQAGTMSVEVDDPEETLNPGNPLSPFAAAGQDLALYRGILARAYWPRTGNLASTANLGAGTYHPGFEIAGVTNGWAAAEGTGTVTNVTTAPYAGTRCLKVTVDGPDAVAYGRTPAGTGYIVVPGLKHTYSAWVRRDAASTGTLAFLNVGGIHLTGDSDSPGVSSVATTSTTWTRLSLTFTPISSRVILGLYLRNGPAGTGTQTVYLDQEEMVVGSSPAAVWQPTGPIRYSLFSGWIERYPVQWVDQGRRGVRPLECVDALSVLSRTIVTRSYDNLIAEDNPTVYIPLDDESGPGRVEGRLGKSLQLTEFIAPKGGAIAWQGDTLPDGVKAVTLSQQLQNPADVALAEQVTELDIRNALGPTRSTFAVNTQGCTLEFWARISASVVTINLQSIRSSAAGFSFPDLAAGDNRLGVGFFADGSHRIGLSERNTTISVAIDPAFSHGFPDGDWHYYAISLRPDVAVPGEYTFDVAVDGAQRIATASTGRSHVTFGVNSILLQALTLYGDPLSKVSVARLAVYPRDIGRDTRIEHYRAGAGFPGETAAARATRLLTDHWGGLFTVAPSSGLTLPADHGLVGGSVLAGLEAVTAADEGTVYCSSSGAVVVESRLTRHAKATAELVFGEDESAGEIPYDGLAYDYDPGNVYSQIALSRPGRQAPVVLIDPAIEQMVGQRVFSKTLDVDTDFQLEEAAKYYLRRYGQARLRVQELRLSAASKPQHWPSVLRLEISMRVTVRRRTAAGATISGDYYIESIKHDIDVEKSDWTTILQLSPVFVDRAWVLGDNTRGVLGSTSVPVY